jgi:hypothetical protein
MITFLLAVVDDTAQVCETRELRNILLDDLCDDICRSRNSLRGETKLLASRKSTTKHSTHGYDGGGVRRFERTTPTLQVKVKSHEKNPRKE